MHQQNIGHKWPNQYLVDFDIDSESTFQLLYKQKKKHKKTGLKNFLYKQRNGFFQDHEYKFLWHKLLVSPVNEFCTLIPSFFPWKFYWFQWKYFTFTWISGIIPNCFFKFLLKYSVILKFAVCHMFMSSQINLFSKIKYKILFNKDKPISQFFPSS